MSLCVNIDIDGGVVPVDCDCSHIYDIVDLIIIMQLMTRRGPFWPDCVCIYYYWYGRYWPIGIY